MEGNGGIPPPQLINAEGQDPVQIGPAIPNSQPPCWVASVGWPQRDAARMKQACLHLCGTSNSCLCGRGWGPMYEGSPHLTNTPTRPLPPLLHPFPKEQQAILFCFPKWDLGETSERGGMYSLLLWHCILDWVSGLKIFHSALLFIQKEWDEKKRIAQGKLRRKSFELQQRAIPCPVETWSNHQAKKVRRELIKRGSPFPLIGRSSSGFLPGLEKNKN